MNFEVSPEKNFLNKFEFFESFDKDILSTIEKNLVEKNFFKNQTIYARGDISKSLYIIEEGTVFLTRVSREGDEVILQTVTGPSVVGEIGFFDGKPREANAHTRTAVKAYIFSRADFINILDKINSFNFVKTMNFLCQRQRALTENFVDLSLLSPERKLIKKLVNLCKSLPEKSPCELRISQEELGNMLDLSRESIGKYLSKLSEQELIDKSRNYIWIHDLESLTQYMEDIADD